MSCLGPNFECCEEIQLFKQSVAEATMNFVSKWESGKLGNMIEWNKVLFIKGSPALHTEKSSSRGSTKRR